MASALKGLSGPAGRRRRPHPECGRARRPGTTLKVITQDGPYPQEHPHLRPDRADRVICPLWNSRSGCRVRDVACDTADDHGTRGEEADVSATWSADVIVSAVCESLGDSRPSRGLRLEEVWSKRREIVMAFRWRQDPNRYAVRVPFLTVVVVEQAW